MELRLKPGIDYVATDLCKHNTSYYDSNLPEVDSVVCIACGMKFSSLAALGKARTKAEAVQELLGVVGEPLRSAFLRLIKGDTENEIRRREDIFVP